MSTPRSAIVIFVAGIATQLAGHLYSAFLHDHESNSARVPPLIANKRACMRFRGPSLTERAALSRANFNARACPPI